MSRNSIAALVPQSIRPRNPHSEQLVASDFAYYPICPACRIKSPFRVSLYRNIRSRRGFVFFLRLLMFSGTERLALEDEYHLARCGEPTDAK